MVCIFAGPTRTRRNLTQYNVENKRAQCQHELVRRIQIEISTEQHQQGQKLRTDNKVAFTGRQRGIGAVSYDNLLQYKHNHSDADNAD